MWGCVCTRRYTVSAARYNLSDSLNNNNKKKAKDGKEEEEEDSRCVARAFLPSRKRPVQGNDSRTLTLNKAQENLETDGQTEKEREKEAQGEKQKERENLKVREVNVSKAQRTKRRENKEMDEQPTERRASRLQ